MKAIQTKPSRIKALGSDFVQRIRGLYVFQKWTQKRIARHLGVSVKTVSDALHGRLTEVTA